jgi:hypothetical protein
MTPAELIAHLESNLSSLAKDDRTVIARYEPGLVRGARTSSVFVYFYNLPFARHRERRGGGAESENNRQLFSISGFHSDPDVSVDKVQVEQLVNNIGSFGSCPRLRKKTGRPENIAPYLASYINEVALTNEPRLTHE